MILYSTCQLGMILNVITSYSIHYTKLYEIGIIIVYMFNLFPAGVKATVDKGLLPIGEGVVGTIIIAFLSSAIMNLTFGPMFMAAHRVSDNYIDGICLKQKKKISEIIADTDWAEFIRFVVGKTIPFFWIPMHTISFFRITSYNVCYTKLLRIKLCFFFIAFSFCICQYSP